MSDLLQQNARFCRRTEVQRTVTTVNQFKNRNSSTIINTDVNVHFKNPPCVHATQLQDNKNYKLTEKGQVNEYTHTHTYTYLLFI